MNYELRGILFAKFVWAFSDSPDMALTEKVLAMTNEDSGRPADVTFHSELEVQDTGFAFRKLM